MRLIDRIRTSRILFRLVYILSPIANLLSPRFSRGENSRLRREAALPGGYINGQRRPPVAGLPYGARSMSYNGCEVIAAYNLLLLLGRGEPLPVLADTLERRGLLLNGLGGTNLDALKKLLRSRGLNLAVYGPRRPESFDAALGETGAGILSFWTGPRLKRPDGSWYTLHTVAVARRGGSVLVFNAFGLDAEARAWPSLTEFLAKNRFVPVTFMAARQGRGN